MRPVRTTWVYRHRLSVLAGIGAVAVLVAAMLFWGLRDTRVPPLDPRLTLDSPFRNVRPDIQYVGDQACESCHAEIFASYRKHPMGQSLAPVAQAHAIERYDPESRNPFSIQGVRYTAERRGSQMLHREELLSPQGQVLIERAAEVAYAVGSGRHGRSYLMEQDGFITMSPITWYPQKARWDLSPGYAVENQHFDRPVDVRCLFCHTNRVEPIAGTRNRYERPIFRGDAIGCERCHGPGGLHVEKQERQGGMDVTIVNPRHLEPKLRDAVCEQCHLDGEQRVLRRGLEAFDYRPGLPLHQFVSIYVRPTTQADDLKFVGHVVQMHASRCFQASAGKMGCISCHDPHALPDPARRIEYYRKRCLDCHAEHGCSVPEAARRQTSPDDSCQHCHMPAASTDIDHAAITDHRIPRRARPSAKSSRPSALLPDPPLVHFHQQDLKPDDPENARDLGIALADTARNEGLASLSAPAAARRRVVDLMLPQLKKAVARDPQDLKAQEGHATALIMSERAAEAVNLYRQVLQQAPHRETTLRDLALLLTELQRPTEAADLWRQCIAVSPYRWSYHHQRAVCLIQINDWPQALEACREALSLNPLNVETRKLLVACLLETGDRERARREFDLLLQLNPKDHAALQEWFDRRLKGS